MPRHPISLPLPEPSPLPCPNGTTRRRRPQHDQQNLIYDILSFQTDSSNPPSRCREAVRQYCDFVFLCRWQGCHDDDPRDLACGKLRVACAPLWVVSINGRFPKKDKAKGLLIHNLGRASNVDMQAVALPLENRVFLMFL